MSHPRRASKAMQECDGLLSGAWFWQLGELLLVTPRATGYQDRGIVARLIGELSTKPSMAAGRSVSED